MPFKKGDPRINRNGRRPGPNSATILRKHLKDKDLAHKVAEMVAAGNETALRLACQYLWGKPVERIEQSGSITIRREAVLPGKKKAGDPVDI